MNERHLSETYTNFFQKFLDSTDEKKVLLEEISEKITNHKPNSLLDIGAGNGELAIPISGLVKEYMALEQKPNYVEILRGAGLIVVNEFFPCVIDRKFDFILASHSLPWKEEIYKPYISSAINLLNGGGTFLGITYDDEGGDWNEMLRLHNFKAKSGRLERMEAWLSSYPKFSKSTVTTYVKTNSLEDMMHALAFVYSDGGEVKVQEFLSKEELRIYLSDKYRNADEYYFPFQHIFLEVGR